jgi:hypothetical protein
MNNVLSDADELKVKQGDPAKNFSPHTPPATRTKSVNTRHSSAVSDFCRTYLSNVLYDGFEAQKVSGRDPSVTASYLLPVCGAPTC